MLDSIDLSNTFIVAACGPLPEFSSGRGVVPLVEVSVTLPMTLYDSS